MPKSKSTETNNDISVDDFFNNLHSANKISKVIDFSETALKLSYHFSINAFPKVHYDIQSPPPRA